MISDKNKEISKTSDILHKSYLNLLEGLTGIATSSKNEYFFTASRLLKSLRGGQFIKILKEEWDQYCQKGVIPEDYQYSDNHYKCLGELLDYLDNNIPNELVFEKLKNIFFKNASTQNEEDLLPYEYLKLIKELNEGEIIVLFTTYELSKTDFKEDNHAIAWLKSIARQSKLKHEYLIELHEQKLISLRLITRRHHNDGSGVRLIPHYRLTSLGKDLCAYTEDFEQKKNNP